MKHKISCSLLARSSNLYSRAMKLSAMALRPFVSSTECHDSSNGEPRDGAGNSFGRRPPSIHQPCCTRILVHGKDEMRCVRHRSTQVVSPSKTRQCLVTWRLNRPWSDSDASFPPNSITFVNTKSSLMLGRKRLQVLKNLSEWLPELSTSVQHSLAFSRSVTISCSVLLRRIDSSVHGVQPLLQYR